MSAINFVHSGFIGRRERASAAGYRPDPQTVSDMLVAACAVAVDTYVREPAKEAA